MLTNRSITEDSLIASAKEQYNRVGRGAVAVYSPHGEDPETMAGKLGRAEDLRQQIGPNARIVHIVGGPDKNTYLIEQAASRVAIGKLGLGRYSPLHTATLDGANVADKSRANILEELYQVRLCVSDNGVAPLHATFAQHASIQTNAAAARATTQNTQHTLVLTA